MTSAPSHRDEPGPRSSGSPAPTARYTLDRASVRAVDRAAAEEYDIPGIVLMENAARGVAAEALSMLGDRVGATVLTVCGSGNNGGDGYAVARHLHNAGQRPVMAPLAGARPGSDAARNETICLRMGIERIGLDVLDEYADADLIIDAIFGTGLDREVTGPSAKVIRWINEVPCPVLSVDVPSGLDCDTGRPLGVAVRADRTVTFVALKPGFRELEAQVFLGDVRVADIGAPVELLERFGRRLPDEPPDDRTVVEMDEPAPRR